MARHGLAAHQKKAALTGAHLVFIDESGFMLAPLVRRTLAPQGQTPILKCRGAHREKVSVVAALALSPKRGNIQLLFKTLPNGSFDGPAIAEFLRDLLRHLPGKVIVVWDNAGFHKGRAVRDVLSKHPRLTLEHLPPYAPELNPVEQLWNWLKWGRYCNYAPPDAHAMNRRLQPTLQACRHRSARLGAFFRASSLPIRLRTLTT